MSSAAIKRRALVLNADYAPVSTWPLQMLSAQEAIKAVVADRVDVVDHWPGDMFRSPSITMPVPKVVVLREYINIYRTPKFCRWSVLLRDRYCCQYCGKRFASDALTFDHVLPRSRGGQTVWENILMACVECNTNKQNSLAQYSARKGSALRPLKQPRAPTAIELMRTGLEFIDDDVRETYGDWLYWNIALRS
jgi:5-methylcytosine-specific restriction endonuclease McrA